MTLTWVKGLLSLGVAGAEGAVQLELVHVIEEGAGDGVEDALDVKRERIKKNPQPQPRLPSSFPPLKVYNLQAVNQYLFCESLRL